MSKVLILGAGASYGHGVSGVMAPPMVGGFFTHECSKQLSDDYAPLLSYFRDFCNLKESELQEMSIETLFAKIEPLWKLGVFGDSREEVAGSYGASFKYVTPLDMLYSYVIDIIVLSTGWLKETGCPYHQVFAEDWLESGDAVISLNYDLIMDDQRQLFFPGNDN